MNTIFFVVALVVAALLLTALCWAAGLIDIGTPPEENSDDKPPFTDRG